MYNLLIIIALSTTPLFSMEETFNKKTWYSAAKHLYAQSSDIEDTTPLIKIEKISYIIDGIQPSWIYENSNINKGFKNLLDELINNILKLSIDDLSILNKKKSHINLLERLKQMQPYGFVVEAYLKLMMNADDRRKALQEFIVLADQFPKYIYILYHAGLALSFYPYDKIIKMHSIRILESYLKEKSHDSKNKSNFDHRSSEAFHALGNLFLSLEDYSKAEEYFSNACKGDFVNATYLTSYAKILTKRADDQKDKSDILYKKAEELYRDALNMDTDDIQICEIYHNLGILYLLGRCGKELAIIDRYQEAIDLFFRATIFIPEDADSWEAMATTYSALYTEKNFENYNKEIEEEKRDIELRIISAYEKANSLSSTTDSIDASYYLAEIYFQGKYSVKKDYEKAIQIIDSRLKAEDQQLNPNSNLRLLRSEIVLFNPDSNHLEYALELSNIQGIKDLEESKIRPNSNILKRATNIYDKLLAKSGTNLNKIFNSYIGNDYYRVKKLIKQYNEQMKSTNQQSILKEINHKFNNASINFNTRIEKLNTLKDLVNLDTFKFLKAKMLLLEASINLIKKDRYYCFILSDLALDLINSIKDSHLKNNYITLEMIQNLHLLKESKISQIFTPATNPPVIDSSNKRNREEDKDKEKIEKKIRFDTNRPLIYKIPRKDSSNFFHKDHDSK